MRMKCQTLTKFETFPSSHVVLKNFHTKRKHHFPKIKIFLEVPRQNNKTSSMYRRWVHVAQSLGEDIGRSLLGATKLDK